MFLSSLRLLAALLVLALAAVPVRAQDEDETPEEEGEVIIDRDGDVYRFRVPRFDGDGARFFSEDTVIDGRRVIRFRVPDGEDELFEFEVPEFDGEHFRMRVLPELERFRAAPPPELFFKHDDEPFGLLPFREGMDGFHFHEGLSEETREEMMELERRARELAAEARRAEGRERDEAERALDDVLEALFDVRGRMREEQAAHLEERAEALREEVRERERERRALIEERKRELLGERGTDW